MPLNNPNTAGVMDRIKTICQALQTPDGTPIFQAESVIVGEFKDLTNTVPTCEITAAEDNTGRDLAGDGIYQGGGIADDQNFLLEITFDQTNAQLVESTQLPQARDALTKTFNATAQLNYPGVRYAGLVPGSGQRGWSFRNGKWWRIYQIKLNVILEYYLTILP